MSQLPPNVDLHRQKAGTKLLVETEAGIWELTLCDAVALLVHVSSTDKNLKHAKQPILGQYVQSSCPKAKVATFENGKLVKGWTFSIRFADAILVSLPVLSIAIEGDGWHYEL